jgi:high-affinity iron transporter
LGTALAIAVSAIVGAVIFYAASELEGRVEAIFEGVASLTAAGLLSWMIFWMHRQSANIRGHLHDQIQSALSSRSSLGLIMLSFVAVVREGIETALFLFAATTAEGSPGLSAFGGILGLGIAIAIGIGVYRGASRLNLRSFFTVTSLLLILFGAGLLVRGIGDLQEAGAIPPLMEHVWDSNRLLPEASTFGEFLTATLGYRASPSLVEVIAYFGYLGLALAGYFYPRGKRGEVLSESNKPLHVETSRLGSRRR